MIDTPEVVLSPIEKYTKKNAWFTSGFKEFNASLQRANRNSEIFPEMWFQLGMMHFYSHKNNK